MELEINIQVYYKAKQFKTNKMKKISKKQAVKEFNNGNTVLLCTSKVNPQIIQYSPWLNWYDFRKSTCEELNSTFEQCVNEFSYYNCNKELGLRVHYYIYSV